MPPENYLRFGEGAGETILHPVVLAAMIVAIILLLLLPRKYMIAPLFAAIFLIPLGQQVVIGGLHFFVYRILILVASVRIVLAMLSSPEGAFGGRKDLMDKIFLLWAVLRASAVMLLFFQAGAVINQMGFLLDAIGGYFVFRHLIRDDEEVVRAIRALAVIAFFIGGCMLYEKLSMVDVFGLLGGVRDQPDVRLGSIRSQGPFQHSLLAGTFGATLLPLFLLLWKRGISGGFAVIGAIGAALMTVTSASSTPVMAFGAGCAGVCLWPFRNRMRTIRWGIIFALIGLHLVMKAPVWFIIQHIDIVGGSSGYHRAMLVNDFIMHFRDWWLLGTKENATWGFNMWDLCNQYVIEGQTGGLAAFTCFIAMICVCFSRIGSARKAVEGDRQKEWYFWLLGCALFAHIVAYFGISYVDQTRFAWYVLLAIIVAATAPYLAMKPVPEQAPRRGYLPLKPAYSTPFASRSKPVFSLKRQPAAFECRLPSTGVRR